MFFTMFWKEIKLKILVYTGKARLRYSCFWAKMRKSHNKNDRLSFLLPVLLLQQLIVTLVSKTLYA